MKKLTITIVNYNGGDYLLNCLESLSKIEDELDFNVVVLDNKSSDGSFIKAQKKFTQFEYIENRANLGFGKAHNIALKKADTPYVLTLNPDCEVPGGTLKYLFDFIEKNSDVGIVTAKVLKADGKLDIACHRGFPTPWASFKYFFLKDDRDYHLTDRPMEKTHEIDSAVGAFMFMRKSVLEKTGYFDEDYFLYGEDIDLCFRVKKAGFKVMFVPDVSVLHVKGVSSGIKKHSQKESGANTETKNLAVNYFYETMKIFYEKHYAKNHPFLFNKLIYTGIDLKWYLAKRKMRV
jgi:GT2 family glycosyltransferase